MSSPPDPNDPAGVEKYFLRLVFELASQNHDAYMQRWDELSDEQRALVVVLGSIRKHAARGLGLENEG